MSLLRPLDNRNRLTLTQHPDLAALHPLAPTRLLASDAAEYPKAGPAQTLVSGLGHRSPSVAAPLVLPPPRCCTPASATTETCRLGPSLQRRRTTCPQPAAPKTSPRSSGGCRGRYCARGRRCLPLRLAFSLPKTELAATLAGCSRCS